MRTYEDSIIAQQARWYDSEVAPKRAPLFKNSILLRALRDANATYRSVQDLKYVADEAVMRIERR